MEKSIETIWKEGFLQRDALIAPKINDLYNQKSRDIVDKLSRMFDINLKAIVGGALAIFVISAFAGAPLLGGLIFVLFLALVLYGQREARKMKAIDKGLSSYEYLVAFQEWRVEVMGRFTRIYRFFYPAFFLTFVLALWHSKIGDKAVPKILGDNPDLWLIGGVPAYFAFGVIGFAILLSVFAGPIYRFDMWTVYGPAFKKLEEIIADMEELRR